MRVEIVNLLKKEGHLSDKTIEEISQLELNDFFDIIKQLGNEETDYLNKDKIIEELDTEVIGKDIYIFKEVMSTNTIAKFFAENKVDNGTVIISEKQTNAKGRSGKPWLSPLGGVWLSIVLHPHVEQAKLPLITLATGVAVENTLERLGIENAEIKWPNDVFINNKKVCGILTEAIAKFNAIESIIVGVGIDTHLDVSILPEELQEGATSLDIESDKKFDDNEVIKTFLEEFEKIFNIFRQGDYEAILKEWRKHAYTIGKIVEVREPFSKPYDAYVVGINKFGVLVVEKIDGTLEKVISGEVIIKN